MAEERGNSDALHHLCFGVLAVQLEFLSASQLMDALNLWIKDRRLKLGQILVEAQKLSSKQCEAINLLIDEYLRLHDGSPHKTLMSLKVSPALKDQLLSCDDPAIALTFVGTEAQRREDTTISVAVPEKVSTRFQKLRPHASGGLGDLYVACDVELDREVVLKEIKPQYARDTESRRRFSLEAQVTGGLEHPGIVPVYGYGVYPDGSPFYAMRLIRGQNLKAAIDDFQQNLGKAERDLRRLKFRALLGRFIDACNAIAYAHSRGVLHRDIKPANVMLGKFGETLVVDWGLAKPGMRRVKERNGDLQLTENTFRPASDSSATSAGSRIGTPAFMSPEQAAGKLDELTNASDIYSLGATLYVLLTGQPPFKAAHAAEMLALVQKGEFAPPKEIEPSVAPELNAICCKAMSLYPHQRYATATALAEDVERWLADEPVAAHRDRPLKRVHRWTRRHRVLVACAIVALVVSVPVLILSKYRIGLEQQATLGQLNSLVDFYTALDARANTNSVSTRFLREVKPIAEMISQRTSGDSKQRLRSAKLLRYAGNIYRLAEEFTSADQHYDSALKLYEQEFNARHEFLTALLRTETQREQAEAKRLAEDPRAALTIINSAIQYLEANLEQHKTESEYCIELANCRYTRALISFDLNQLENSQKDVDDALLGYESVLSNQTSVKKGQPKLSLLKAYTLNLKAKCVFKTGSAESLKIHELACNEAKILAGYTEIPYIDRVICVHLLFLDEIDTRISLGSYDQAALFVNLKTINERVEELRRYFPTLPITNECCAYALHLRAKVTLDPQTQKKDRAKVQELLKNCRGEFATRLRSQIAKDP